MKLQIFAAFFIVAGCIATGASPSPAATPTAVPPPASSPLQTGGEGGVAGLVTDLAAAGAAARADGAFTTDPIGGSGTSVCVGRESVNVYVFASDAERAAAVARIDRRNPSHVGNGIVEWVGSPRFWQRDRIIVLYTGSNAPAIAALTSVLGQPFAATPGGGGPGLPNPACT